MVKPKYTEFSSRLWRGPRPTTAAHFAELKKIGPRSILSLESGWYQRFHPGYPEFEEINHGWFSNLSIPFSPLFPPTLPRISAVMTVLCNTGYSPVILHCKDGVDRTGVVVAFYEVYILKHPPEQAIENMLKMGFHSKRYAFWMPTIRRLLAAAAA